MRLSSLFMSVSLNDRASQGYAIYGRQQFHCNKFRVSSLTYCIDIIKNTKEFQLYIQTAGFLIALRKPVTTKAFEANQQY